MITTPRHICCTAVLVAMMFGPNTSALSAVKLGPGAKAPTFSGEKLDGGTLALEPLRGSVVLLNFWAVECPPCRIEMPELEKIHRQYSKQGLRVLGVIEMDPVRDEVLRSVAEIGVTYPILLDPGGRIATLYAIEAHPTSIVIDAKGIVRFVNAGYLKGEEKNIEGAIKKAFAAPRKVVGDKP